MKKNEYVSPEMEIVEINAEYSLLGNSGDTASGIGGLSRRSNDEEDE